MSSCNGNCSSCGEGSCSERTAESLLAKLNPKSSVKKGEFVNVNLKAHRATILYTTDFDCKLKMYYFGK